MIPELGQFALILALIVALLQAVLPMAGAIRDDRVLIRSARSMALSQWGLLAFAFGALTWAHANSDFSVVNVFQNSHTDKPFIYKLSGVWGNHEGSMLLWVLIIASYSAILALRNARDEKLQGRTLAVQGAVSFAFLAFIVLTSNPFARAFPAPANGMDLNPLLQDPGLAIHPPFLYLGYVGFSITFAFAIAGLISGKIDEAWAATVRPWALAAWVFLTIGIALGSWWAYYELGWGGFWAWDPVENASFMPWLAGTAFIHSVRVLELRGALKVWNVLLAISAFSLSLIGTFLVRSGIITSVHSFAVDPTRGVFILAILGVVIGGSLLLFALRAPLLTTNARFAPVSREGSIIANNILLSVATVIVFLGTFFPLFYEAGTGAVISIGAPYFNFMFRILGVLLFFLIAPAAMLAWKRGDGMKALKSLWPVAIIAVLFSVLALYVTWPNHVTAGFGLAFAVWAGGGALLDLFRRARTRAKNISDVFGNIFNLPRPYLGMTTAHLGLAVALFGVLGAGVWRSEQVLYMKPGDAIALGGYEVTLNSITQEQGPNFVSERANFGVGKNGVENRTLIAERRYYPVRGMQTTEAGIWTTLQGDLYLVIGEPNEEFGSAVRAWFNPFAVWMWIGSALMALGGIVAAVPRRSPQRRMAPAGALEAAE